MRGNVIVILATFRPICPSAFFRFFMSNLGVHTGVDSSKKEENSYYLKYSDFWPHHYRYTHGILTICHIISMRGNVIIIFTTSRPICPSTLFRCFISNLEVHTESWTEPFIWTTGVGCSNSVNHDQVQHETLEEKRRIYRPKRCEYNNKDEDNSLNILKIIITEI